MSTVLTREQLLDEAAEYLKWRGITVLDRNWSHAEGVIDLAASERGEFVAVKVLAHPGRGKASPRVSQAEVRRQRHLAAAWMGAHGARYERIRVDSITILALTGSQAGLTHDRGLG